MRQALLFNRVALTKALDGRTPWELVHDYHGTLGVIAQSAYQREAPRAFPHAEIRAFDSWASLVQSVRAGDTLGAYRDELSVQNAAHADPRGTLAFQTIILSDTVDDIAVGVRYDSPALLAFVNDYIALHGMPYKAEDLSR